jgi:hypothetical protein
MSNKWLVASIATLLLVSGCSSKTEETVVENEPEKEVIEEDLTKEEEVVEEVLPYQYPLTGVGTEIASEDRAVAVMINNDPKARPQSGLDQADVVYELLAEGGVTRYLAIFQSEQPEKIGPVRSARDYYIELAKGYDSLYINHGHSPDAEVMLKKGYIDHLNGLYYDGTLFKRSSDRKAPHNSYISFENILKGAEQNNYSMEGSTSALPFLDDSEIEEVDGEVALSAMVSYFNSSLFTSVYEYDEELEKYKRYVNGELTADYDTGNPVLLDNIFIVEMNHKVIDSAGRRSVDLTSGGNGYLLQKGKWKEVEWKNIDGKILPVLNGEKVGFVPGKTWINVIDTNPGLEQSVSFDVKE